MTSLIDGYTTLKCSPVIQSGTTLRQYRLCLTGKTSYVVHCESREPNGASGEQFLHEGYNLDKANDAYNYLIKLRRGEK